MPFFWRSCWHMPFGGFFLRIDGKACRRRHSSHDTTSRAHCGETPMRAIVPLVNSRKSASMPSEKITPFDGMSDSIISSWPCSRNPATRRYRRVCCETAHEQPKQGDGLPSSS